LNLDSWSVPNIGSVVHQYVLYCIQTYTNIEQTLVNSLHGLLNCEISGLDYHVITIEYNVLNTVATSKNH